MSEETLVHLSSRKNVDFLPRSKITIWTERDYWGLIGQLKSRIEKGFINSRDHFKYDVSHWIKQLIFKERLWVKGRWFRIEQTS